IISTTRTTNKSYSFRPIKNMDIAAFRRDILSSKLFDNNAVSVDDYADLFDVEVMRVIDIHAPLQTKTKQCGKNDSRWLSTEAREAKRLRRKLERQYCRTGLESDKIIYKSACATARNSIMQSRSDHINQQLDAAAGNHRATWQTAQTLLHKNRTIIHDDADSERLVDTFSFSSTK